MCTRDLVALHQTNRNLYFSCMSQSAGQFGCTIRLGRSEMNNSVVITRSCNTKVCQTDNKCHVFLTCIHKFVGRMLCASGAVTDCSAMCLLQVSMHMMNMTRQEGTTPNRAMYTIPTDPVAFEQWQLCMIFMMASEPYPNVRRPANVRSSDELVSHLLSILRCGVDVHMQAATAALGVCHPAHLHVTLQV